MIGLGCPVLLIIPRRTELSQILFVTKVGVYYFTCGDNLRSYVGVIIRLDRKWNIQYWYWLISHKSGKLDAWAVDLNGKNLKWYQISMCSWIYSCERRFKRRMFILEVISKEPTKITELVVTLKIGFTKWLTSFIILIIESKIKEKTHVLHYNKLQYFYSHLGTSY